MRQCEIFILPCSYRRKPTVILGLRSSHTFSIHSAVNFYNFNGSDLSWGDMKPHRMGKFATGNQFCLLIRLFLYKGPHGGFSNLTDNDSAAASVPYNPFRTIHRLYS